jgi:O-antigen/teichoic acid export membrane protein
MFNMAGRFWAVAVAFFLTPYIIHTIGVERYGVWALVGVITSYFGLLDFGVTTSLVKFVSEYYSKDEPTALNRVIHTSFVFYSGFGILIAGLGMALMSFLLRWFSVPEHLMDETRPVFQLGIMIYAASNLLNMFAAILNGLQRMDVTNKVTVVQSFLSIAGTILFLEKGYGLIGLMLNNAIVLVAGAVMNGINLVRVLPDFKLSPFRFDLAMLSKQFKFGIQIWTAGIASLFHYQYDKLLLAHFAGLSAVAYYDVASRIVSYARELPLTLGSAIMPAASELNARDDRRNLEELYARATKYILLAGMAVGSAVILFAKPFVELWLGADFEKTVTTIQILMVAFFFNTLTASGYFMLNGIGQPQYGMKSSIAAALLNFSLSTILMLYMGYFGVVTGTAISMVCAAIYFIMMVHKVIRRPIGSFWFHLLAKPLAAAVLSGVLFHYIQPYLLMTWFSLSALAVSYLTLFGLATWMSGYFDPYDKQLFERHVVLKFKFQRTRVTASIKGK